VRSDDDRIITGLAGGIGEQLGISPSYVRAGFIAAVFAGGVGLVLYVIGWALSVDAESVELPPVEPASFGRKVGIAFIYVGAILALRSMGVWFSDQLFFPIALLSFGAAAVWDRTDAAGRGRVSRLTGAAGADRPNGVRILVGALLMTAGLFAFVATFDAFADAGPALLAVFLTASGFMLVFGSWVWRLAGELSAERRERIRSEERSEMAAHLHDSVLQTLAMIQRSDDPRHMVTLARGQERELREWLYGRGGPNDLPNDLEAALTDTASRVESTHDFPIDVVVVGDSAMTEDLHALTQAAGEAMTNAARHSGASRVSVFAEVADGKVDVYVADQGKGFDPDVVAPERRGLADSIRGRMKRHGGEVVITSNPGEGTEVHLSMAVDDT
jgi:signal transduction histidine kinase/phage shock protein PspC (stress-responsive transcriptional regulator)